MLAYLGHVRLLSASALPNPASYSSRGDRARNYNYLDEFAKPPSVYRRRPPQLLRTAHLAHRRHSSALSTQPYPSPESETEPFYLQTLTQRVANRYDEGTQAPQSLEREEKYDAKNSEKNLQNLSVRLQPDFERSNNWTPKHQDSIISSWVNALSSLFSTSKPNNSTPSLGDTTSVTSTKPRPEDEPDNGEWTASKTIARYDDPRSPESSRYAAGDVRRGEKRARPNEDGYIRDRVGSHNKPARSYESGNRRGYVRSDEAGYLPSQRRRQRTQRERDSTQRVYGTQYDTPTPRKSVYTELYSGPEADLNENERQDIERRESIRRAAHHRSTSRRRDGESSARRYGGSYEEDEFLRPRYENRDAYDDRNLNENTGRQYPGGYMPPPPEGDSYYGREDRRDTDMESAGQGGEGDINGATDAGNVEPVIDDRNAAVNTDQKMPPLSRTETREMVQLFRRLFDALDNTLDGPENEYRKRAIQEALPDVHVALAEAEKLNMQRDLDRKAGISGDSNVGPSGDVSMRMAEESDNDASDSASRDSQASGDGEKERDNERDIPADVDDESLQGVPPSSPAYGTRRKLLRQKSKGFIGGLYDSISSSISAIM